MAALAVEGIKICITAESALIYGIRIRMYVHTFYNIHFRIPFISYVIIEVQWSVRWRGYDGTGHKVVALDLEAG